MMAEPNAISHGSNGAGGGALTALVGKSAAKAEPVTAVPPTIASAVANNTTFFMTIPITVQRPVRFRAPPGASDNRLQFSFFNVIAIWDLLTAAESKKGEHLPTF